MKEELIKFVSNLTQEQAEKIIENLPKLKTILEDPIVTR